HHARAPRTVHDSTESRALSTGGPRPMSDRYQGFVSSPVGKFLVKNLGLPSPTRLERWSEESAFVDGTVLVGGTGRLAPQLVAQLKDLEITATDTDSDSAKYKGLVFDATGLESPDALVALREFFTPVMRRLESCPRVVVLGTPPELLDGDARIAQ